MRSFYQVKDSNNKVSNISMVVKDPRDNKYYSASLVFGTIFPKGFNSREELFATLQEKCLERGETAEWIGIKISKLE